MSTMQEREEMIDKAMKAGMNLTYIVYILDYMMDFIKEHGSKPMEEKLELVKQHRWLGADYFVPLAGNWLKICEENHGN